jgi:hypothetical protein
MAQLVPGPFRRRDDVTFRVEVIAEDVAARSYLHQAAVDSRQMT